MSEWKPIETCPAWAFDKDKWFMNGPRYLVWIGYVSIGSYGYTQKGKGRWQNHNGSICPTHWMPLPPPPEATP